MEGQLNFLMEQVARFETDYFELSEKVHKIYHHSPELPPQQNAKAAMHRTRLQGSQLKKVRSTNHSRDSEA